MPLWLMCHLYPDDEVAGLSSVLATGSHYVSLSSLPAHTQWTAPGVLPKMRLHSHTTLLQNYRCKSDCACVNVPPRSGLAHCWFYERIYLLLGRGRTSLLTLLLGANWGYYLGHQPISLCLHSGESGCSPTSKVQELHPLCDII